MHSDDATAGPVRAPEPQRKRSSNRPATSDRPEGGQSREAAASDLQALQRSAGNAAVVRALDRPDPSTEIQRSTAHRVLGSSGRPLEASVRADMEGRLGADFGAVRVHDDAAARRSATELGARAYTSGRHIVLGTGGSDAHTLAHELTHVIQQRHGPVAGTDDGSGLRVSDPSDRFERAAEANAHRVMSRPAAQRSPAPEAAPPTRSDTAAAVAVQRLWEPATIIKAGGAHLHRDLAGIVLTGGPVGVALGPQVPVHAAVQVDPAQTVRSRRRTYYRATWNQNTGYLSEYNFEQQIEGTNILVARTATGFTARLREASTPVAIPGGVDYVRAVAARLSQATAAPGPGTISNREDLLWTAITSGPGSEAMMSSVSAGNLGPWDEVPNSLATMRARVAQDRALLVPLGITPAHQLDEITFSGADFHAHGEQVLFLTFRDGTPAAAPEVKIVYKPRSVAVDAELFGGPQSVARLLDPTGNLIGTYQIVESPENNHGYQQFVESSGPTDKNELLGVYTSIGASMAMGYVVGLEDVHEENILLLRDRVQLIDMEAITGIFDHESRAPFSSQLWHRAINTGIAPKLIAAAGRTLVSAPSTADAVAAVRSGFTAVLERHRATGQPQPPGSVASTSVLDAAASRLNALRSRLVPIATQQLTNMSNLIRAKQIDFTQWTQDLARELQNPQPADRLDSSIGNLLPKPWNGMTAAEGAGMRAARAQLEPLLREFAHDLLVQPSVFEALARGEVPVFERDLGSQAIFDELGQQLTAVRNAGSLPKIGGPILNEMRARAADTSDRAQTAFESEAIEWISSLNQKILAAIPVEGT